MTDSIFIMASFNIQEFDKTAIATQIKEDAIVLIGRETAHV